MSATVEKAKIVRKPYQINSRISSQHNIVMSTEQVVGVNNSQPKEVVLDRHESINTKLYYENHPERPEQSANQFKESIPKTTNAQTSNSIATIISQRSEEKDRQQANNSREKKRDGSAMGDAEPVGGAKKSMLAALSQSTGLVPPFRSSGLVLQSHRQGLAPTSQFSSPSPVLQTRSTRRHGSTSRDHKRENSKNRDESMNYEDY